MDKFKKYGPMGIVMMIFLFAAFIFLAGLAVMVLWKLAGARAFQWSGGLLLAGSWIASIV